MKPELTIVRTKSFGKTTIAQACESVKRFVGDELYYLEIEGRYYLPELMPYYEEALWKLYFNQNPSVYPYAKKYSNIFIDPNAIENYQYAKTQFEIEKP